MLDTNKTKEQLLDELTNLRQRISELEAFETERLQAEEELLACVGRKIIERGFLKCQRI